MSDLCQDCLTDCRKKARWRVLDEATPDDDGMIYCDEHVPDGDPGVHVFVYVVVDDE